jgi:hypothetical protein
MAGRVSPRFWGLDTGVSEPPTGISGTSGTSGPMLSRALEGVGRRAKVGTTRTRRQASRMDRPPFCTGGHPSFGDISFISVVAIRPPLHEPLGRDPARATGEWHRAGGACFDVSLR